MKLTKFLLGVFALAGVLALPATSIADDETVSVDSTITPQGAMYVSTPKPVDYRLRLDVSAPPSSPKILPMKQVTVDLPDNLVTRPNESITPPCTDSKLSATSNLADPSGIVAGCPDSIVGTGTAALIIAKLNQNPAAVVSDPILIIFYAGKNQAGQALLKLYGYSNYTRVGLLLETVWQPDRLDLKIPVLSNDSAASYVEMEFPGPALNRPDIGINVQGKDPGFVRASCPTGTWTTGGTFQLGERTYPGGTDTSPTTAKAAAPSSDSCVGAADPAGPTLTVTKNGKGLVTSSPAGIHCGATCSALFGEDSEVTLTAQPGSGAFFSGWTGACSGTGSCKVTLSQATQVGATFGTEPPAGPVGVSVNGGARYTNDPKVRLSLVWPYGEATGLLSNDGGFVGARTVNLAPEVDWTLDSSGPERLPKTVYVRFGASTQNYTDDIILDETAPVLSSVSAGGDASGSTARSLASVSKSSKVTLKIKASDKTSGVSKVQVGAKKSAKLKKQAFKSKLSVRSSATKLWVRVFDRAGNASKWKSVKLRR